MQTFSIVLAILTVVLVAFQLICGFWLVSNGMTAGSLAFHRNLGLLVSVSALATAVVTIMLTKTVSP